MNNLRSYGLFILVTLATSSVLAMIMDDNDTAGKDLASVNDPNVIAAEKAPHIFAPVPQRENIYIHEHSCSLVEYLETLAEKLYEEERQQQIAALALEFRAHIIEPVRAIAKLWRAKQIVFHADAYWQMRLVIEDNLELFHQSPVASIKNLKNIVNNSQLPFSVKRQITKLISDYYERYDFTFWKYHTYFHGALHLCHCLPDWKNSSTKGGSFY